MLVALAWRNLARNLRRSILTGAAVAFGLVLIIWMRGFQDGGYRQMIDQAVRTRLGHLQVLPPGSLTDFKASRTLPQAEPWARSLAQLEQVRAVAPRAIAEGMVARDGEMAPVDVLGVDPRREAQVSIVPRRLLSGERGEQWCRSELGRALQLMGGNQALFDRWCQAAASSRYLPDDRDRATVLGAGVAKRLLVSVGDEVTVQVIRAVSSPEEGGPQAGELSQRRLEVVGLVRTGNPEIDDRVAYVRLETLTEMLGTENPNELVILLDDIRDLDQVKVAAAALVDPRQAQVTTWEERNPALKNLIQTDSQSGNLMYVILILLVALGVVNATSMSVLERTREFGVMLALGMSRVRLFALVMTEVALLGLVAVTVGATLGGGFEIFGRVHGWPMEWFGGEALGNTAMSGVVYDPIYYSALSSEKAVLIVSGIYVMFLLAGLLPALRVARLQPVAAMRQK